MIDIGAAFLVAIALLFAWSMGAHYTGACMGMAHASHSISLRRALLVMAPLTLVGAVVASGAVETTVGQGLLGSSAVTIPMALAVVGGAFGLTTLYNVLRLPTSTIQILVFSVAGVGIGFGVPVEWATVDRLLVVWALVPPLAAAIAFIATRLADRSRAAARIRSDNQYLPGLATGLVLAGAGASFVMGANDVSNASGAFIMTGLFGLAAAGFVGGVGLAVGVLTWREPLLRRVALETVKLDRVTATVSQAAQAVVVFVSVLFGYFTSLNQALIGAMAGTGLARGRGTIRLDVVRGVLLGWAMGPVSAFAVGLALAAIVRWTGFS